MPETDFPYQQDKVAEITVSYRFPIPLDSRSQIRSSCDALQILRTIWDQDTLEYEERMYVLFLNRSNHLLGYMLHSIGGLSGTVADVKQIFAVALKANAASIIVSHNHPSSNTAPSSVDKNLTKKMAQGATLLDLHLLDHIILTRGDYYSFGDAGLLTSYNDVANMELKEATNYLSKQD